MQCNPRMHRKCATLYDVPIVVHYGKTMHELLHELGEVTRGEDLI